MWFFVIFTIILIIVSVVFSKRVEKHQEADQEETKVFDDSTEETSQLENDLDFAVIDFETATHQKASACEIGVCVVEKGEIVLSKSWLIQPPSNKYERGNIRIHGITPDMTAFALEFSEIWEEVYEIIEDKLVVSHNADFDMGVLKAECDMYGVENVVFRYMCSLKIARKAMPYLDSYKLDSLCDYFDIDSSGHHRAENDCIMTAKMLIKICEDYSHGNLFLLMVMFHIDELIYPYDLKKQSNRIGGGVRYSNDTDKFLKEYVPDKKSFDNYNPFYEKEVVFTGKMKEDREVYLKMISDIGGKPWDNVRKSVDYLVVADTDYELFKTGIDVSGKIKKAKEWIAKGVDMKIISESEFLSLYYSK